MKISLVGHFDDSLDEGVRNVARCIARELKGRGIEVKKVNISSVSSWKEINAFQPDIVHFVMSSTIRGIIVAKIYSTSYIKAKTVISAIQPAVPNWKILKIFKPDLILVQSEESKNIFKSIGFHTEFLSNGVDINKFKPVDIRTRQKLREKYGISTDRFIILHLASMTKERNLNIFKELQKQKENQVLIIGRENENADKQVLSELQEAGCTVWIKHFPNIEEIYNLSDCYLFPTIKKEAGIETPLSVLEAMACNLPLITTKYGALPRIFKNNSGLFFIEEEEEIHNFVEIIKKGDIEIKTREKVVPFSWGNVAKKLEIIYNKLLN